MSTDGLTSQLLRQQHADAIEKAATFRPQGVDERAALNYLKTDEGALYYWRVAESAEPGLRPDQIADRAIGQIMSGRELPRMEALGTSDALVKFVADGASPNAYSPFFAREADAEAATASGKNISEFFALPIGSEAPRYGMYRMTPLVPTQIFVNTVAPTSELGGLVIKPGGAEQTLVPNRKLFTDPVYVKTVENIPQLAADIERGGLSPNFMRSAGALGTAAVAIDATQTAGRTSALLHQGNRTGAASAIEHFGARNLGAWGGAVLGAQIFGTAGAETGPADLVIGGAGAIVGAVVGDKLIDAYDNHKIYNQTDPQGTSWQYDPKQPQQGWTRTVVDTFAERGLSHAHVDTAPPALAERLTFQANNTAVELALAHPTTPRDPWTQPAGPHDRPSRQEAFWTRDAQTHQWSRTVTEQVLEHGLKSTRVDMARPARTAELDAAAQRTIVENLANTPRGIAERYQTLYAQNGWAAYGPMPESVAGALKTPGNTLEASDGHTYTRGRDGQWSTPGVLWGTNAATGAVRQELDATRAAEWPVATPPVGAQLSTSLHPNTPAAPSAPGYAHNDPRHADNLDHALYRALRERIPEASEKRLLQFTAACLAGGITQENLGRIAYDEQRGVMHFMPVGAFRLPVAVDVTTPSPEPQQSIRHIEQFDRHQAQSQVQLHAQQAPIHAQARQGPSMGGPGF